jgi:hypothetical protein
MTSENTLRLMQLVDENLALRRENNELREKLAALAPARAPHHDIDKQDAPLLPWGHTEAEYAEGMRLAKQRRFDDCLKRLDAKIAHDTTTTWCMCGVCKKQRLIDWHGDRTWSVEKP